MLNDEKDSIPDDQRVFRVSFDDGKLHEIQRYIVAGNHDLVIENNEEQELLRMELGQLLRLCMFGPKPRPRPTPSCDLDGIPSDYDGPYEVFPATISGVGKLDHYLLLRKLFLGKGTSFVTLVVGSKGYGLYAGEPVREAVSLDLGVPLLIPPFTHFHVEATGGQAMLSGLIKRPLA